MSPLQKELEKLLLSSGAHFIGFADMSHLGFPNDMKFQIAVAIGISYDARIVAALDTNIDAFETHLHDTSKRMEKLLTLCNHYLQQLEFTTWVPPISKNLPGLLSDFSHKMAATRAGLGWIGKSSLFISKDFGCGVRLATVLTNAPFQPGTPITVSHCGRCVECVKACPYGAIKGVNWYPGIEREKLFDAFLCSRKREEYISKLGYKHPCGLCIKACPIGKRKKIIN
jgi:epoxyqueuosine reductase QueG